MYIKSSRYSLKTPRLFEKFAFAKVLNKSYEETDKYWWRLVPEYLVNMRAARKIIDNYVNCTLGGKEFQAVLMNQMTAKEGIKKHGELAIAALINEITQSTRKGCY